MAGFDVPKVFSPGDRLSSTYREWLIAELEARSIRLMGIEGADPSWLGPGLPPLLGRRASQQERMKIGAGDTCRTSMSDRLSGRTAVEPAVNSQQKKMKDCNARAGEQKLTGDARRTFMSSCLKGT